MILRKAVFSGTTKRTQMVSMPIQHVGQAHLCLTTTDDEMSTRFTCIIGKWAKEGKEDILVFYERVEWQLLRAPDRQAQGA